MLLLAALGGRVGVAGASRFLVDVAFQEWRGDAGHPVPTAVDEATDLIQFRFVVVDDALAPDAAKFDVADAQVVADGERVGEVFGDLIGDDAESWHGFSS